MPTLRFSRDRRGYESTYLVHTSKRRPGQDQSQLLYWFRTPPHVKIGRAAFDEEAIRMLEDQHPDVEFDWDRILTTRPPAAPEPRDAREARPPRRQERRPVREVRRELPPPPIVPPVPSAVDNATSDSPAPIVIATAPEVLPADHTPPTGLDQVGEAAPAVPPPPRPAPRRFVRVFDLPAVPDRHASEPSVAERMLGAEQLTLLRARYAEILARISARGGDPARLEALREQAGAVNPDAWVTESDVTAGLAAVDATLSELHRIVGRRRRRRRHRRQSGGDLAAAEGTAEPPDDDESAPDE